MLDRQPGFWTEVLLFLKVYLSNWQSYAAGGLITGLIGVGKRLIGKPLPKRIYFLTFVVSFSLVAFFLGLRDEYRRAEQLSSAKDQLSEQNKILQQDKDRLIGELANKDRPIIVRGVGAGGGTTHTFTNVQRADTAGNCLTSSASCTLTVSSTGLHNAIVLHVLYSAKAQKTISSISGGCNTAWTIPAAATAYDNVISGGGAAAAFCCDSLSGVTAITLTMNSAPNLGWTVFGREYSYTGGGLCSQDNAQGKAQTSAANPIVGITAVLTGTSDLRVQGIASSSAAPTSVSTFTNLTTDTAAGMGASVAELVNTSVTEAPNWTYAAVRAGAMAEIALK